MNAKANPRPLPEPTPTTQPFWDGAKKRKLMLQYDPSTRGYQFYPRQCSVRTGKRNLQWKKVSGRGTLYSYTWTYVPTGRIPVEGYVWDYDRWRGPMRRAFLARAEEAMQAMRRTDLDGYRTAWSRRLRGLPPFGANRRRINF